MAFQWWAPSEAVKDIRPQLLDPAAAHSLGQLSMLCCLWEQIQRKPHAAHNATFKIFIKTLKRFPVNDAKGSLIIRGCAANHLADMTFKWHMMISFTGARNASDSQHRLFSIPVSRFTTIFTCLFTFFTVKFAEKVEMSILKTRLTQVLTDSIFPFLSSKPVTHMFHHVVAPTKLLCIWSKWFKSVS